jgi:hypothetical protein
MIDLDKYGKFNMQLMVECSTFNSPRSSPYQPQVLSQRLLIMQNVSRDEYTAHLVNRFPNRPADMAPQARFPHRDGERAHTRETYLFPSNFATLDPLFDDPRLPKEAKMRVAEVLQASFAQETASTSGAGVRGYIAWCESLDIDPVEYFPAPAHYLVSYVCHVAGTCSESTARGYISELKAWHVLSGADWNASPRLEMALIAAGNMAPEPKSLELPLTQEVLDMVKQMENV